MLLINDKKNGARILITLLLCSSCGYRPGIKLGRLSGILILEDKCPVVIDPLNKHKTPIVWSRQFSTQVHKDGLSVSITSLGWKFFDLPYGSEVHFGGGQARIDSLSDSEHQKILTSCHMYDSAVFFQVDEIKK